MPGAAAAAWQNCKHWLGCQSVLLYSSLQTLQSGLQFEDTALEQRCQAHFIHGAKLAFVVPAENWK